LGEHEGLPHSSCGKRIECEFGAAKNSIPQ
jgi:hypothetical protein